MRVHTVYTLLLVLQVSISSTFYVQIFLTNVVFLRTCNKRKQRSYEKFVRITLMKLTTGLLLGLVLDCDWSSALRNVRYCQRNAAQFCSSREGDSLSVLMYSFYLTFICNGKIDRGHSNNM